MITSSQNKLKYFIIFLVVLVLIFGGIIGWIIFQKPKLLPEKVVTEEVFTLSGVVSKIDLENNFLMVKPSGKENQVEVILSETTKLIKLEAPFSPENPPPPGTQFTPKQTEITLGDFKEGDEIFIKTTKNIADKTEFNNIEFIQILP